MKEVLKEKLRRSLWLEIDLDQLESNYLALKEMVGSVKVMPAVKANGYGHGIVQCSQVLAECGADYLGVGSADEAILLRENGVRTPILVFESSFIPDMAGVFKEYDLKVKVHLDGARLFNAAVALNIPVSEIARYTDSVMFCVSKGIGAPFGSLVCGEKTFIDELRNTQKRLGGGMRQAGIMAAPALYAMKNLTERLKEDHMHARKTADGLKGLRYVHPQETIETNIVMLKVIGMDAGEYCQRLKESGVFAGEVTDNRIRLVFYRGITDKDVEDTVSIIRALDESLCEIK